MSCRQVFRKLGLCANTYNFSRPKGVPFFHEAVTKMDPSPYNFMRSLSEGDPDEDEKLAYRHGCSAARTRDV